MQPVFAVNIAGDDEGDNVIAGRVDHRRGGIDQIAERQRDGEGDGQMIREEDRAQNQLARAAAAGDAGHGDRREHGDDDRKDCAARREVLPEHSEQERDLDDGGHGGAVHVHRRAERDDDVGNILGDSRFLRDLHVCRNRRDGRARAETHGSRAEQLGEHDLRRALSAAEAGVDRGEDEHINKTQNIIDRKRAAIIADETSNFRITNNLT